MGLKREKAGKEFKKPVSSVIMYVVSILIALVGVASLINSIRLFNLTVNSYVAQGYQKADILKQIVPGQLLPAIFEAFAYYGGIALILLCAGIINTKVSKSLILLSGSKNQSDMENEEINKIEDEPGEMHDQIDEAVEPEDNK